MKQSFAWKNFFQDDKHEAAHFIRTAAEIGYAGVEFLPQEHWQLAKDHGLMLAVIGGHKLNSEGLNRREHFPQVQATILANLGLAVQWGISTLICFSGNREGLDEATGAEITAEHLRQLAPHFEDAGVTLVLELLNSKLVAGRDYMADHTAWGVKVCQMVDSPRVRLLYDIFQMQIMEGDIIRTIQHNHAYIAHYHTAGNPGRNDLDDAQELNYRAIMQAIAETGYDGYIGHEFHPKGDALTALKAAFELCDVKS